MNNKSAIGTNTTSPGRECEPAGASDADRASCMLMEAADFFAATHAQADPRAWKHLLVYLPETSVESGVEELCKELESPVDERTVGSTTETRKFYNQLHLKAAALIRRLVAKRDEARIELGNVGEDYREQQAKLRNTFADAQSMKARATAAEAEVERLRAALKDATAHLAAATSSYRRFCRKGVTGDALFSTKLSDYQKATNRARTALEGKSDG